MTFNLADLFEAAVDAYGDREYLVADGKRRTYAEMEERANRLAHHLAAQGVGPGDHVGIYSPNSVEWVETAWAVFKLRAVWININYRYVKDELRYLFGNADLVALVHQAEFGPRVTDLLPELPDLRHVITVADDSGEPLPPGAVEYEAALASGGPERDFGPRSDDDHYILYTGGTTGLPKGVVWRHRDVFYALGGGVDPTTNTRIIEPGEMVEKGRGGQLTMFPIAPLMHGATQWAVMGQSFVGNRIILMSKFDPHQVWRLVEEEAVNSVMITGDAMGKPLVEALDDEGASYDLSSLLAVTSSAALFSAPVKDQFFEHFPNLIIVDAIGSSESGNNGMTTLSKGNTAMKSGPTVKVLGHTVVFDEEMKPVQPGSGVIGKIARGGDIPVGYYNDPAKTAETFVTIDGHRYSMPGDFATIEEDGSITLLGRGSVCINSGGEKIFPEEVESAVRSHPEVYDAIVVGAADERWGQRVAAIIQPRADRHPSLEDIQNHCREAIAGYKVPRQLHVVEVILRSPSGKPDYRWAATVVEAAPEEHDTGGDRTSTGSGAVGA
ncbi:MAG: acyl-CoA synthetase [Acidimicrobiales bacterium]